MMLQVNERPVGTRLGQEGFARLTGVSRETLDRLGAYVELLRAWNSRINLVGPNTLGDVWRRHILDSAQLMPLLPGNTRTVIDLGSGAGLPGMVLAVMGVPVVHLVESDQRKAAFLREAKRVTGAAVDIHAVRAEKVLGIKADVVVARALAPVDNLLHIVVPFLGTHSICLFLKGRGMEEELREAERGWRMTARITPSRSDPSGRILRLENIAPIGGAATP